MYSNIYYWDYLKPPIRKLSLVLFIGAEHGELDIHAECVDIIRQPIFFTSIGSILDRETGR